MRAYTRLESVGATATSILPSGDRGSPGPETFDHVVPPSCETWMPLPAPPLSIAHGCISTCHVPANSVRGFFMSIESPEQPVFSSTKRTRSHVSPPSVVRNTPRSS